MKGEESGEEIQCDELRTVHIFSEFEFDSWRAI